jgi:hypothetical protein
MAKLLSTEQLIAIGYLSLPKKDRPIVDDIAKECGVHRSTIFEWKKDPVFEAELKRQMVRNSQDKLPDLIASLSEIAIRDGNAAMAKLALQINGLLTDKLEVETKQADATDIDALKERIEAFKQRSGNGGKSE